MRHACWFTMRIVAVVAAVGLISATPASAHGGGGTDASNYRTSITSPGDPGLIWDVVGGDGLIVLVNDTGAEVVVEGYENEPYVRFVPGDGVYENVRSPATYLNRDRYAGATMPADTDPTAPPEWRRVADGSTFSWHDHRAHWMSPIPPPQVQANRDVEQLIFTWEVPVSVAGVSVEVAGELSWVPSVVWWPPLAALGGIFAAVALTVVAVTKPDGFRWRELGRPIAIVLWAVAAANLVRTIDDMIAAPATAGQNVYLGVLSFGSIIIIVALAQRVWSGRAAGFAAAMVAAVMTLLIFGGEATNQLSASQLVTELPFWVRRWTIAASYMVIVPTAIGTMFAAANVKRHLDRNPGTRIRSDRLQSPLHTKEVTTR